MTNAIEVLVVGLTIIAGLAIAWRNVVNADDPIPEPKPTPLPEFGPTSFTLNNPVFDVPTDDSTIGDDLVQVSAKVLADLMDAANRHRYLLSKMADHAGADGNYEAIATFREEMHQLRNLCSLANLVLTNA